MVAESLGIDKKEIIFDDRVGEINLGNLEGKTPEDYHNLFESQIAKFTQNPMNGETLSDVKKRASEFIYEINEKYEGKNILIVTHEYPAWMFITITDGLTDTQSVAKKESENLVQNAQIVDLDFRALPHNKNFEIDLHMPFIDEVKFTCGDCGGEMTRIPEVFDCWFESGAMPYASNHYPFENLDKFNPETEIGFPADFIAEGLDQTRGWFYTSLVLSTALFEKSSYKNVIVNGLILAEDGKKMSKSLKNYPDVNYILDKYGADAMRYYMINSPAVHAEDLNFSEKGVDEVLKKIILKVKNVLSFYELYASKDLEERPLSENVLDKWIIARLNQLNIEITKSLDNYELDRATRPILDFVEDFSTWYIRRSRDRFKGEDVADRNFALETTKFVLKEFSKLIAPIMPFLAEEIWLKLNQKSNIKNQNVNQNEKSKDESIHLQDWPVAENVDEQILEQMQKVREIVSLALEARAREGVKVRQPLNKFTVYSLQITEMDKQLIEIIKDEVNVKDVVFEKGNEEKVVLDTEITSELKAEGDYRELLRNIQRMRKEAGLVPSDLVDLSIETSTEGKALVEKFADDLKRVAGVKEIKLESNEGETVKIDDIDFHLKIVK
jgi:isoleucyl-tRNA synthetase